MKGRGATCIQEFVFVIGRGLGNVLILWRTDVEPLVLATVDHLQCWKEVHVGFKAAGSLRTSSKGSRSSSALECLPPLDSTPSAAVLGWLHLPMSSAAWPVGCSHGLCSKRSQEELSQGV